MDAKKRHRETIVLDSDSESESDAASLKFARQLEAESRREAEDVQGDAELARQLQSDEDARHAASLSQRPLHGRDVNSSLPMTLRVDAVDVMADLSTRLGRFSTSLCRGAVTLAKQQTNWTCGYENLGVLIRRCNLRIGCSPPAIQAAVAAAWQAGFDPEGARARQPLRGKSWIGTAEMIVLLWHSRVDAIAIEVVGDGDARMCNAGTAVFDAIKACYLQRSDGRARISDAPIILQHSGHSRTVLGITAEPPSIVVRDPQDDVGVVRCLRPACLDGRQYQLVVIQSSSRLSDAEAHRRTGTPRAAAIWRGRDGWKYPSWFGFRF